MNNQTKPLPHEGPGHEIVYIECECSSRDHAVCFTTAEWNWQSGEREIDLYLNTQMTPSLGFFARVKAAFNYLLRPRSPCGFGHWNEMKVSKTQALKIREIMDSYLSGLDQLEDSN